MLALPILDPIVSTTVAVSNVPQIQQQAGSSTAAAAAAASNVTMNVQLSPGLSSSQAGSAPVQTDLRELFESDNPAALYNKNQRIGGSKRHRLAERPLKTLI